MEHEKRIMLLVDVVYDDSLIDSGDIMTMFENITDKTNVPPYVIVNRISKVNPHLYK